MRSICCISRCNCRCRLHLKWFAILQLSRHVLSRHLSFVIEMINGHALVISPMATAPIASRVSRIFAPRLYEVLSERHGSEKALLIRLAAGHARYAYAFKDSYPDGSTPGAATLSGMNRYPNLYSTCQTWSARVESHLTGEKISGMGGSSSLRLWRTALRLRAGPFPSPGKTAVRSVGRNEQTSCSLPVRHLDGATDVTVSRSVAEETSRLADGRRSRHPGHPIANGPRRATKEGRAVLPRDSSERGAHPILWEHFGACPDWFAGCELHALFPACPALDEGARRLRRLITNRSC